MNCVFGWMTLKPGRRAKFLEQLRGYVEATRSEPGVLFFDLLESADSPDVVVAIEGYASAEAHEAHTKAPHRTTFKALFQTDVPHRAVSLTQPATNLHHSGALLF